MNFALPVLSPHADLRARFWLGRVRKATCVAQLDLGITLVSFHGYNGWPRRSPPHLADHVRAVLRAVPQGPCLFAGDFNTFTKQHHTVVADLMREHGLSLAASVAYDGRRTLDLAFTRGLSARLVGSGRYQSDHPYMVLEVSHA
jgi:endonuclease/exonuclease/phosphatase (EEP) superfamily protein YafD